MKLKKLVLSAIVIASLGAGGASADIILNPSAPNAGAVGGTALDPTTGAFNTFNSQIAFTSRLDINGTNATQLTPQTFSESVNFQILNFNPQADSTSGVTDRYNVYGTAQITGSGVWVGNQFVVNSFAGLNVNVYGSPGCTTGGSHPSNPCGTDSGLRFAEPTTSSASTLAQFGITPGSLDFLLGTAAINLAAPNQASATIAASGNSATETINAELHFTPAPGTFGIGGFWQSLTSLGMTVGSQAGGNSQNTTFSVSGGVTTVIVHNTSGIDRGGGSLDYSQSVPEPASIALLGLALAGMGFMRRRQS
ncbi:MAG TPA: PEP-CTERM sorting domain-containing protein [Burkholderiales bacterium]|nr:PEP-CTERM sorting domain-containing protein [Burkholderiales bacterium]